jgi:hypothetical protein
VLRQQTNRKGVNEEIAELLSLALLSTARYAPITPPANLMLSAQEAYRSKKLCVLDYVVYEGSAWYMQYASQKKEMW